MGAWPYSLTLLAFGELSLPIKGGKPDQNPLATLPGALFSFLAKRLLSALT